MQMDHKASSSLDVNPEALILDCLKERKLKDLNLRPQDSRTTWTAVSDMRVGAIVSRKWAIVYGVCLLKTRV